MTQNEPHTKQLQKVNIFYSYFIKLLMIFHFRSFRVILCRFG